MKSLIYILAFLIGSLTFAQNENLFEQGNTLYNNKKYAEAIDKYQAILNTGMHSAELYFNLGNAHYKLNHIAPSIYYYEKALLLSPKDKDILNNMAYAKNMTIDAIEEVPEMGISKLVNNVTNVMTYNGWAVVSVLLFVLFVLLFLTYYFAEYTVRKRMAFTASFFAIGAGFITLLLAFHSYSLDKKDNPAIVFAQESQVKSEPNLSSQEVFKLHEGTKVNILDTVNNWKRIKLADGKTGWISSEDIKKI